MSLYATSGENTTIGIILDPDIIYKSGIIQCMQITDQNSSNRTCNINDEYPPTQLIPISHIDDSKCTCLANTDSCKTNKEYKQIQAGCGAWCWDDKQQCGTINWCDPTNSKEIIQKYASGEYSGYPYNCQFKPPPDQFFLDSAIAWRKGLPNGPPKNVRNLETELNATVDVTNTVKQNMWLKAIIGVFHTAYPGYMCACNPDDYFNPTLCVKIPGDPLLTSDKGIKSCCQDDQDAQLMCQKRDCRLDICISKSDDAVKTMVKEYNTKISKITGHQIKGWRLDNLTRHNWNGWSADNNYTVQLEQWLTELV